MRQAPRVSSALRAGHRTASNPWPPNSRAGRRRPLSSRQLLSRYCFVLPPHPSCPRKSSRATQAAPRTSAPPPPPTLQRTGRARTRVAAVVGRGGSPAIPCRRAAARHPGCHGCIAPPRARGCAAVVGGAHAHVRVRGCVRRPQLTANQVKLRAELATAQESEEQLRAELAASQKSEVGCPRRRPLSLQPLGKLQARPSRHG